MRMWMVNPKKMCNQHLLGEHVELHMFAGTLKKGISVEGYIKKGLLEPKSIIKRHEKLAKEMKHRGMKHQSPLKKVNLKNLSKGILIARVDKNKSLKALLKRCKKCRIEFKS